MGKYYYVDIVNSLYYHDELNSYQQTETSKQIANIANRTSLGYSEPYGLALTGIKKCEKRKKEKGIFGLTYINTSIVYEPVFIICEEKDDHLEEVITGRKYELYRQNSYNTKKCEKLVLRTVKEIPSSKVVEMLKELSNEDLNRFSSGIKNLEQAIYIGYKKDIARENNAKIQQENNDAYIKSFRNKYGK